MHVCVCVCGCGHFVNQRAITRTVVCKCIKFIFHLLSCIKQHKEGQVRGGGKGITPNHFFTQPHVCVSERVCVCFGLPFGMQIKRQKWPSLPLSAAAAAYKLLPRRQNERERNSERARERESDREQSGMANPNRDQKPSQLKPNTLENRARAIWQLREIPAVSPYLPTPWPQLHLPSAPSYSLSCCSYLPAPLYCNCLASGSDWLSFLAMAHNKKKCSSGRMCAKNSTLAHTSRFVLLLQLLLLLLLLLFLLLLLLLLLLSLLLLLFLFIFALQII